MEDGGAAGFGGMVGCDGRGSEKSNRSLEDLAKDGFVFGAVVDAKSKSPSPLEVLGFRKDCGAWPAGFDTVAVFGAALAPRSKKPPPLSGGGGLADADADAKFDGEAAGLLKLAKGSALGVGLVWLGGGDVVEVKDRVLNASSRPPEVERC